MFIPNTTGQLSRRTGVNKYAEGVYASPVTVACAVIHLQPQVAKTSVRTDSSASRGNAEEKIAIAKLLFPVTVAIAAGDKFEILGSKLRVIKIEPRLSVLGQHDHNEVDFEAWTQ